MPDKNDDPTNVPVPESTDDEPVSDELDEHHDIPADKAIDPDPNLSGYQDELATGDAEDEVQHEQGDTPADVTLMPESVLKEELDKLAMDEQEYTEDPGGNREGVSDDDREHIEDVDEADKR